MERDRYLHLKQRLVDLGYQHELDWAASIIPCESALAFWMEYSWVVINSGMKEQIARTIWNRIQDRYEHGGFAIDVFGHKEKAKAIDTMWHQRCDAFNAFNRAPDKLIYLHSLPWIGPITKYHLAKNLGLEYVKPDRHLVRIAGAERKTPEELCQQISTETGDRLVLVDSVLWRAANLGLL